MMLGVGNLDAPTAVKKIREIFDNYRDRKKDRQCKENIFAKEEPI